jgi:hypothetical protein
MQAAERGDFFFNLLLFAGVLGLERRERFVENRKSIFQG